MEEIIFNQSKHHPFEGKTIVFTGALRAMTRNEAAKKARLVGAEIAGAVTKQTDFVVLGKERPTKSTKQMAAERFIAMGEAIQILHEDDFFWVLAFNS